MKLKKNELALTDFDDWRASSERPDHQLERGPRHGNNRKMLAKEKVNDRRRQRHQEKRSFDYMS